MMLEILLDFVAKKYSRVINEDCIYKNYKWVISTNSKNEVVVRPSFVYVMGEGFLIFLNKSLTSMKSI